MNIKKLASLLFQRSVIVALLIFLQAAMLLLYMLWFSSDFIYVYWGCVVLSILAVLIIVSRQTDPGYKIAWIIPILLFPALDGWCICSAAATSSPPASAGRCRVWTAPCWSSWSGTTRRRS